MPDSFLHQHSEFPDLIRIVGVVTPDNASLATHLR